MAEFVMTIAKEAVDIILAPMVIAQYYKYSSALANFGVTLLRTDYVGYFEADVVAARKYPGSAPIFAFKYCFPKEVWILVFVSMVCLSLISSFDNKLVFNYKKLLKYFYNYLNYLLWESMEKSLINSSFRQILIVWLLSAFVLSIHFTAYLMDYMISAVPMVKIDSLNDLAQQDHMKIVVRFDDSFVEFVNMKDSPLKKRLSAQLLPYELMHHIVQDMIRGLRNGSLANVSKRNMGIFNMLMLSEYETRPEMNQD